MIKLTDEHTQRFDSRLYQICMVVARLGLAFLFFTQLWWKAPPDFGCDPDFNFTQPAEENYWTANGSSGLCFWMGLESVFADQPRRVLVADMRPVGGPNLGISITPLAKMNGFLVDNLFAPNIQVFGWLIWLAELWIFISMLLGVFTRLGAIVSIGVSLQLFIGLANIPRPYEWEWSYGTMVLLSIAMLAAAGGRFLGVDRWIRDKLVVPAERGNVLAKIGLYLT
jgi:hypothetical protein